MVPSGNGFVKPNGETILFDKKCNFEKVICAKEKYISGSRFYREIYNNKTTSPRRDRVIPLLMVTPMLD